MKSSKEKNYNKVTIITILITIIAVLGTVSYAFYQTAINGTVSGTIAEWNFTANNKTDSFNLDLGELYPGKSGVYNITLSASNSELDVYYELVFTLCGANNATKFMYWDSSYTKKICEKNGLYDNNAGRYGIITKDNSITIPIYFNWPYGDTAEEYYEYSMPEIEIIAKQYTGYNGSIPMYLHNRCKIIESINSTSGYCGGF
jgi:hypothetical protein